MKQIFMNRKSFLITLMLLLCLCCFGCDNDVSQQPNQQEKNEINREVYVVHDSSRTTNEWDMKYGAIKADGTMVLPMEYHNVILIEDIIDGAPLWLQTYELVLKENQSVAQKAPDEMIREHYECLGRGEESPYFVNQYKLYDLEGNLLEDLGSNSIAEVCGNFILYIYNNQGYCLVYQPTGEEIIDGAVGITWAGDYYVINYDEYKKVCVMDRDLNVLLDCEGSYDLIDGDDNCVIITKENGLRGLCRIDGTQVIPNEYDYINAYYSTEYVRGYRDDVTSVISLKDGSVVYQTKDEYDYVQEMFDDYMVIQRRIQTNQDGYPKYQYQSQFFNYEGEPVSQIYKSLTPQNGLYERTKRETGEGVLMFTVTTQNGRRYIMDANEREVYPLETEGWSDMLTPERVLDNQFDENDGKSHGTLCALDGTILNEKDYESVNILYFSSGNSRYQYGQSNLVRANYQYNNIWLTDVLDADGNILLEQLKSVTMLSNDLFWVEKGFSQGLMDREGNWLYEQSLFDGAADE